MRKITSFYYLNYPDDLPGDPIDAYSEIYVEIGDEGSTTDHFEDNIIKNALYAILEDIEEYATQIGF